MRNFWCCFALSLSLGLASLPVLGAVDPHCTENQLFWLPNGTATVPAGPDWSSAGVHAAFKAGPCLALSAIGLTQTWQRTLILISRSDAVTGFAHIDGRPAELAYGLELNLVTGQQRGLDIVTNAFCGSGQNFADGSMLSVGGDWSQDYAGPGEFSIRSISPCLDGKCTFSVVARLAHSRWYPTTAMLGDGRMVVVGGSSAGVGLTTADKNVPWVEYYPKPKGNDQESYQIPLLKDALPYNLFPFVHVLPSGKIFIFASHIWTLWDTATNAEAPGVYPPLDAKDDKGSPLRFSYPTAATSAMFPLSSANQYSAEIMICGGSSMNAIHFKAGTTTAVEDFFYPASNRCFRISPEAATPAWEEEVAMAQPRVMPMAVLLPDGHLAILGGMQQGHSGLGQLAHVPALLPELYDTGSHTWYGKELPPSRIPRTYHSEALLLHDGSVFVAGSNPNTDIVTGGGDGFPTEFRSEYFYPPYMMGGVEAPVLVEAPGSALYGTQFDVTFTYATAPKDLKVVAAQPGYSTHSGNHGMRNVILDMGDVTSEGAVHTVTVDVPKNANLLPPSWYWVFVVVNGVPNGEGHACFIKASAAQLTPAVPDLPVPKNVVLDQTKPAPQDVPSPTGAPSPDVESPRHGHRKHKHRKHMPGKNHGLDSGLLTFLLN